ncbi:MAG: hypothetical protein EAZ74_01850 [Alphaproteobacteria bacterium]|nr:MAG: hypothetical protein EAY76_06070 [Alphaproteobacteria bacterium]TAF15434.1 MAG: hypothetical protein EAZ74_01850 [Alphaproteobacteria bacterium]TAF40280.1 MAG: hypothetical protein EAZ66_03445 [Alphaproteobacteria bacterium]TAF77414.1 MAG: hypothetical protein EAZ52_00510 [Alphaproteobacteria bacterium]
MATMVLSTAGSVVGSAIGGPIGGMIGATIGSQVGGVIDNAIFGTPTRYVEGRRLHDLSVQVSTYGAFIPSIYGTMRVAGNVIWSRPIKEISAVSTQSSGGKGGGGGVQTQSTSYHYSVTLAIALCSGVIESITRAWADAQLLDLSQGTYRIYHGTEDQLPDPIIEAFEGVGTTPAYRGLAYVVIEDFPLADYGNRIPNFTFEVKRPAKMPDYGTQSTEEMITAMTIIPGSGEFVYDTVVQTKIGGQSLGIGFAQSEYRTSVNKHTSRSGGNVLLALDQLKETCPNVEWVSVIVTWFGTHLDAGACTLMPCVEYSSGAITQPDAWHCAGYNRSTARPMTIVDGVPRYGGTPSDTSVLRLIDELKARGYKVMLYPMFFMDVEGKPWRGRVTGSATNVANFFTKAQGYNAFITHYATLGQGKVDAFVIGSELIGLTSVSASVGVYPAVDALVNLAAQVRSIMGTNTKITYAADWSEYHHTTGGWYNLDPLWASSNIDMIGIDAYFPLTDAPQTTMGYDVQQVIDGWNGGEGYDYYYADSGRTLPLPLAAPYAWKNLSWFWNNNHVNPNGVTTAWIPQSKKIWFTEYGFPSVDGATNQPNVFYDPASVESFFPRKSLGLVDIRAQRMGITGTQARWLGSAMVEHMFLWTWDARPFPYYPDLRNVWADGGVWAYGHWVTGKFGMSGLGAIVRELCLKAGLSDAQIDVSRLNQRVDGYMIANAGSARSFIEELMACYFFDVVERGSQLVFVPRGSSSNITIAQTDLVVDGNDARSGMLQKTRQQEVELPQRVEVAFIERIRNFLTSSQHAVRHASRSNHTVSIALPVVLSATEARIIAQRHMHIYWAGRTHYRFMLGMRYAMLEPNDVIAVQEAGMVHQMRIKNIRYDAGRIEVEAISEAVTLYREAPRSTLDEIRLTHAVPPPVQLAVRFLDLPALPSDAAEERPLRIAIAPLNEGWRGAVVYRDSMMQEYVRLADTDRAAVIGRAVSVLGNWTGGNRMDRTNSMDVRIIGAHQFVNVTELALLNGANALLVGEEIIQFQHVEVLGAGHVRLSNLLRGRQGTEHQQGEHGMGEWCVLLDAALLTIPMPASLVGLSRAYKTVPYGQTLGQVDAESFTYHAKILRPYSVVHPRMTINEAQDIIVTWVRRDRVDGAWRDGSDVALSEASERYEVDVYVGGDYRRTLQSTQPTVTYTSSMRAIDGGVTGISIECVIYQYSAAVGRGYPSSVSLL